MRLIEYRCVLVDRHARAVLALDAPDGYRLPRISVAPWDRPAQCIQSHILWHFSIANFVLDLSVTQDGLRGCAIAQLLEQDVEAAFTSVRVEQLASSELSLEEIRRLRAAVDGTATPSACCIGWPDEAIRWVEAATGERFTRKRDIKQWNAGGGFVLLGLTSDRGAHFWLKARGGPGAREAEITLLLSSLYPQFLPRLVAYRQDWNAWLTEDAGVPLTSSPTSIALTDVALRFAQLQTLSIKDVQVHLAAGAMDHRLSSLKNHIDQTIAYLTGAMERQISTKAAPLGRSQLAETGEILGASCIRLQELGMPDTLLHNDLNAANILCRDDRCLFIDWCEAAVGHPFLACERLCQLNPLCQKAVRNIYRSEWSGSTDPNFIEQALTLAKPIAIYAYLYGRGDSLLTGKTTLEFDSYARSLGRHLFRATQSSDLRELLCR